jgi:hypothetical protein
MIWQYFISYFSSTVEEGRIPLGPEPKGDSIITIKYKKEKKVFSIFKFLIYTLLNYFIEGIELNDITI